MKVFVKTLKGTSFAIEVDPQDKVGDVKRAIETSHGKAVYPAEQQMLIHSGKVLKDETTLAENNVADNGFLVIMLSKTKGSSSGASTTASTPANQTKGSSSGASTTASTPANQVPPTNTVPAVPSIPASAPSQVPAVSLTSLPTSAPTPDSSAVVSPSVAVSAEADMYDQAASNLVAGNNLEQTIQQLLDMGGGTWDRDTVSRALRAAYNNPERAVEYLYSGIPDSIEAPPVARPPVDGASAPAQIPQPVRPQAPSGGPNANPLDLFPQGLPSVDANTGAGSLEFLRNSPQFRALQSLVQANPQILQPMLQELAKQNPQIMRLIQEHQGEFLRLINEPVEEGAEGDLLGQLAAGVPQAIQVTPEEQEAIERLEAMGFDRALVVEVFFACNKNEELAANYLLDHMHEFEE